MAKKTDTKLSIADLRAAINKSYPGTLLDSSDVIDVDPSLVIPTGSILLDNAIGVMNGWPYGRIVSIEGREKSGKSTLCIHAAINTIKANKSVLYVDAEQAMNVAYAASMGLDIHNDNFMLVQPDTAEDAFDIVVQAATSYVHTIIVDSVSSLLPRAEKDGESGDSYMGLQARLISQACRRLAPIVNKHNNLLIFVNQVRAAIGMMGPATTITPGGYALQHATSLRIKAARTGTIKRGDEALGEDIRFQVVKSKVGSSYVTVDTNIYFGIGISAPHELIKIAIDNGIVTKSGAWLKYDSESYQGMENLAEQIKNNPEKRKQLADTISLTTKYRINESYL